MARLSRAFFDRYTPTVARALLGTLLVRRLDGRRVSGIIVETEAYRGTKDPASHAYRGETGRNSLMFGDPGHAYIYFTYGFHHLLNFTTEAKGTPGAVLIRALEPVEGVEVMAKNRGLNELVNLTNGPGKLAKALMIDKDLFGEDLIASKTLFVERGDRPRRVGVSSRVGIVNGAEYRWRFYVRGNPFVSKGKPSAPKP